MAVSDVALAFFVFVAFLLRSKEHWKRTTLYVMGGVLIGDITGAVLIAVFYHWHPGILGWVRYLMTVGAIVGGIYDWLTPASPRTPNATEVSDGSK
jgi:hypothetical protein